MKEMKRIIMCFMIGMFFISLTSATSYLGTQYEDVNIVETCVVDGFPCPSDFLCNITISNPDNDLIVLNSPMTRNDTIYNYTFTSTDVLGDYDLNVYCSNVTLSGNAESSLEITTTGRDVNPTLTIIILAVALSLFLIALFIKSHAVGFIAGILMVISGVNILVYGLTYINDMYTRSIALVILGFGLFIMLIAGWEWLSDLTD